MCTRCKKSSRECTYSLFSLAAIGPKIAKELPVETVDEKSESSDFSDTEVVSERPEVVKFSSSRNPPAEFDPFEHLEIKLTGAGTGPNVTQSGFDRPRRIIPPALDTSTIAVSIPRSPGRSHQDQSALFFLQFHQEKILPAHYFVWHDYHDLVHTHLPAMATQSLCLKNAMVAFSALVFSMKFQRRAREIAFFYYAMSVSELRLLLNYPLPKDEVNAALATVMQLASFDVLAFQKVLTIALLG